MAPHCGMQKARRIFLLLTATHLGILGAVSQRQSDFTTQVLTGLKVGDELRSTQAALIRIDNCREQLPPGDLKQALGDAEESLIEGLLIGWNPTRPRSRTVVERIPLVDALRWRPVDPPLAPPGRYLESLVNDGSVCEALAPRLKESQVAQTSLELVVLDLTLKFRDCYFHGMSRLISVRVTTIKENSPDPGWTVYFKWVNVSGLPSTETPFRKTSTPAEDDLPPGVYQIRAEKRVSSSPTVGSETKMVRLDEAHRECELQVP